jgi:hypothetical protein
VAAKHDGKRARANMWVTHQNLARSKGGRPGFMWQDRQASRPAKAVAETAAASVPADPADSDGSTPEASATDTPARP